MAGSPASRVTILVVTYNGRDFVADCLESAVASGADVLVVDNASSDGTPDLIAEQFPGVRLLRLPRNVGYGEACNVGAGASASEYLAVLNQDAVAEPGWLDALVAALDADPSAGLATPKIVIRHDPERVNACGNSPHFTGITPCRGYNQQSSAFTQEEEVPAISGAAFLIRASVLAALGGFDGRFFMYFEDTDLSLRAYLAGYRCLHVPAAVVQHDFNATWAPRKLFYLERNRQTAWLKIFRWRTLLVLSPALLLTELVVLGYTTLRGPRYLLAKLSAASFVVHNLPDILRRRRQVQSTRHGRDAELLARCTAELDLAEIGTGPAALAMSVVNPFFRAWFSVARSVVTW